MLRLKLKLLLYGWVVEVAMAKGARYVGGEATTSLEDRDGGKRTHMRMPSVG